MHGTLRVKIEFQKLKLKSSIFAVYKTLKSAQNNPCKIWYNIMYDSVSKLFSFFVLRVLTVCQVSKNNALALFHLFLF